MRAGMILTAILAGGSGAAALTVGEGQQYSSPFDALAGVRDGDTVLITAGTYEYELPLDLRGMNDVSIMGEEGAALVCTSPLESVVRIVDCRGITVSGLSASHRRYEDETCYGDVFILDSSDDVTIENCRISGCGTTGVYTFGCGDVVLRDNYIYDNTICAVQYEGHEIFQERHDFEGLTMEGNTILNHLGSWADRVLSSGTYTGHLAGISIEDGYLVMTFTGSSHDRLIACYRASGCRGPWLELLEDPRKHVGSLMEYEWRRVLTSFPPFDYSEDITEITSIRILD